jgi:hypothetical protein
MWLTYHMMKWDDIEQTASEQKCTLCGRVMMRTELLTDEKGINYEGFVCHLDKQVTWIRAG